ncbi:MAG: hypothetical protein ACT4OF_09770 [Caulobacteraceae bacterium]
MMKTLQVVFGAFFILLGAAMLLLIFRDGGNDGGTGRAAIGPLALMGAGALAISSARRKPKKW